MKTETGRVQPSLGINDVRKRVLEPKWGYLRKQVHHESMCRRSALP